MFKNRGLMKIARLKNRAAIHAGGMASCVGPLMPSASPAEPSPQAALSFRPLWRTGKGGFAGRIDKPVCCARPIVCKHQLGATLAPDPSQTGKTHVPRQPAPLTAQKQRGFALREPYQSFPTMKPRELRFQLLGWAVMPHAPV